MNSLASLLLRAALEYVRRAATPFLLSMLCGFAMLSVSLCGSAAARVVLLSVGLCATYAAAFLALYSEGGRAKRMKRRGELTPPDKPECADARDGRYHICREYRPYKGAVIGILACLLPAALALTAGNFTSRLVLLLAAGWAYLPALALSNGFGGTGVYSLASASASAQYLSLVPMAAFAAVCAAAYVLGGRRARAAGAGRGKGVMQK